LLWQQFGERFSDELFGGFSHQPAEGGVDIAHDARGSFHRGHRQRRVLGDREAETRELDWRARHGWFSSHSSFETSLVTTSWPSVPARLLFPAPCAGRFARGFPWSSRDSLCAAGG